MLMTHSQLVVQFQHPKRMSIITSKKNDEQEKREQEKRYELQQCFFDRIRGINLPFYITAIVGNALILIQFLKRPV